jgi:hypothetical protein
LPMHCFPGACAQFDFPPIKARYVPNSGHLLNIQGTRTIVMSWQAQLNHARPQTGSSLTRTNDERNTRP